MGAKYRVVCRLFLDNNPDSEERIIHGVATFHPYMWVNPEEVDQVIRDAAAVVASLKVNEKA